MSKCSSNQASLLKKCKDNKQRVSNKGTKERSKQKLIELPGFLRKLGAKHVKIAICYLPSLLVYTAATAIVSIYIAEWKSVLRYLPFYGGKYDDLQPSKKINVQENEEISSSIVQDDDDDVGVGVGEEKVDNEEVK